jgi:predicted small lipoprotein YifL
MNRSPPASDLIWFLAIQEQFVTLRSVFTFHRIALAVALVVACGLSACGRKSVLDLPPGAALESDTKAAATNDKSGADVDKDKKVNFGSIGSKQPMPPTPKGSSKSVPLDVLLD